jgi:hypothetical protein
MTPPHLKLEQSTTKVSAVSYANSDEELTEMDAPSNAPMREFTAHIH